MLGFLGPFLDLPVDLNILPGIALVFVSRILRAQAARREPVDFGESAPAETAPEPRRPLNTERAPSPQPRTEEPRPAPGPATRPRPAPAPSPSPVETEGKSTPERGDLEKRLFAAGMQLAGPSEPEVTPSTEEMEVGRPLSSAEMIARAHERWNKRP